MRDRSARDQFLVLNFYVRSKAIGLYTFKSSYAVCIKHRNRKHTGDVYPEQREEREERGARKKGEGGGKERRKRHVKAGEYERGTATVENPFAGSAAIVRNSTVSRLFHSVRARASVKREPFIHSMYAVSAALFLSRPYFN